MRSVKYEPVFSVGAWETLISLSKARQLKVANLVYTLSDSPFAVGDYRSFDADGRVLENISAGGFLFTYWPDHATKEIRIVDLIEF